MNKRMNNMLALAACLVFANLSNAQEVGRKPNIIVFLVDDMGWQDTSLPFGKEKTVLNKLYHTPNMEQMAQNGMMFTEAYASSVCSPTRVSLLTGMNAARHRVTNWTLRRDQAVDGPHDRLEFPKWNVNGLQPEGTGIPYTVEATTLPMLLKGAGYHTIHVGKAHFGAMDTPGEEPLNLGFDVNIAGHAAGGLGSYLGTENFGNNMDGTRKTPWGIPGLEEFHGKDIFVTEALTQKAVQALEASIKLDRPFFLYMAHYAVHIPFNADKRYYQKYIDRGCTVEEAQYASMVEGMDKSLGDIMGFLEQKKLSENTIVLFLSDNGGFAVSNRGHKGKEHQWNMPLKSGKGSAYEGGVRVPMLASWSGKVKGASMTNTPVLIEDVFATLIELGNASTDEIIQPVDGLSFVDLLEGSLRKERKTPLIWHYPNEWGVSGPGIGATSSIRDQDWKLIYWHESGKKELYNVKRDISEENDLTHIEVEKTKELSIKLGEYLRSVDAQMPLLKASGQRCPFPDEV